jgi:anaphase-promoting complex subunit 8
MGHEHLEMKNIPSAIECYRTAIDINPNDFRAWYGLGQTYEIHQMYNHAVFYFLNAAKTKPNDSRMWTALGSCYDKLDKKLEAIKSYEKALNCKDKEGIALFRIGKLYESIGEEEKAVYCFRENIKLNRDGESDSNELMDSYIFLARYFMKNECYDNALEYLNKLKDYNGPVSILIFYIIYYRKKLRFKQC